jgi:hypothetical protein
MTKLSPDQAFELANEFHDISVSVGNYRFDNWDDQTPSQRRRLEDLQWTLMNYSSHFVGLRISLTVDDLKGTLKEITDSTSEANQAIAKIKIVNKVIVIAASAVVLGAAIMSGNADGALKAAEDLIQTVELG